MKRKLEIAAAGVVASAVFAAAAIAASSPAVVTGGTSSVGDASAVLHGTVNPNGSSSTYYFQWGLTNGYGDNGTPHSAGSGSTAVAVKQTAGGLIPGTTYHYRVVATNQFGTSAGADRTFKTAGHPPPGVATGPAAAVNATGATLTGAVNPAGATTTWWFQWGASASYGQQTAQQTLGSSSSQQNVAASLQGLLAPGTIYHYRLVASHPGSATSVGSDASFMTYPSPRPIAGIAASTRPRHPHHAPYVLSTSGAIGGPSWMPAQYACAGNVTIRFFRGLRQVGFTLAGVQPNCSFAAQTVFQRIPGRRAHGSARLRIVIRFVSTPYLGTNRAALEHVTLG
jgi:phosphodiesterase/alkaline phosphatase D-like protein